MKNIIISPFGSFIFPFLLLTSNLIKNLSQMLFDLLQKVSGLIKLLPSFLLSDHRVHLLSEYALICNSHQLHERSLPKQFIDFPLTIIRFTEALRCICSYLLPRMRSTFTAFPSGIVINSLIFLGLKHLEKSLRGNYIMSLYMF